MARLLGWEWFKVRRRVMPWILLAILLLFSQLALWGPFFAHRNLAREVGPEVPLPQGTLTVDCRALLAGESVDLPPGLPPAAVERVHEACEQWTVVHEARLERLRAHFVLPSSLLHVLTVAQSVGLFLIAIFAASTVGTEYDWGTLRAVLLAGSGRRPLLAAKMLLLALLAAAALVVALALTVPASALAGSLAGPGEIAASVGWGEALLYLGRMWLALLPYLALAAAVSVATTSAAAGIGITLAYHFAEAIVVAIMITLFDWFQTVADYLLGRSVTAWVLAGQPEGMRLATVMLGPGEYPGGLHALAVMLGYGALFCCLALWLFKRQDIKGAGGG